MVEDRKSTAKEELKWRAEFETLGREAVRAKSSDFRPYIKRDLPSAGFGSRSWWQNAGNEERSGSLSPSSF
jgi:hypothetical protein